MVEIVFRGPPEDVGVRIKAATEDMGDLLDLVGQRVKEASILAFRQSRLGELIWPPQYPGTPAEEFVNIAGALADLNEGTNPTARRFARKPPLRDTSGLLKSVAFDKPTKDSIRIGTTKEYAPKHQFGLNSSQPVTPGAKEKLKEWLKLKAGKEHGAKLAFLLNQDTLWTQISERPFLGVTPAAEKAIRKDVETFFKRRLEQREVASGNR